MSLLVSENIIVHHPDWVSMDIDKLGRSLYNSEDHPLSDHIRSLKAKAVKEALSRYKNDNPSSGEKLSEKNETENQQVHQDNKEIREEPKVSENNRPQKVPDSKSSLDVFLEFSRSTDGLISNDLRVKIWPLLLGIDLDSDQNPEIDLSSSSISSSQSSLTRSSTKLNTTAVSLFLDELQCNDLPPHKDEDQVKLDIQRSFTILNHIQAMSHQSADSYTTIFSKADIDELKKRLLNLIIKILRKYPCLNYYQGYHDIASIVLLVCNEPQSANLNADSDSHFNYSINEEAAFKILETLTVFHLRDYMTTDINLSVNHLRLIPALLECADSSIFELIKQTSNSYIQSDGLYYDYSFYQALSSLLTFYSHDLSNIQQILTLWDFSLSYNSVLINVYIYVAALIFFKEDIFAKLNIAVDEEKDFSAVDQDVVHTLLSPANLLEGLTDNDLIKILNITKKLVDDYSFHSLTNATTTFDVWFKHYNKNSVLMNTSAFDFNSVYKHNHYSYLLVNEKPLETVDKTNNSLNDLMQLQDEEMSNQTIHDLAVRQKITDQQEELANSMCASVTDIESSNPHSLSSSLTLGSSASSINTKIVHTSSMLFKKIFRSESHDDEVKENKKLINRNKDHHIWFNNIYKISFTIGFVGFMIHFLLMRNHSYTNGYMKLFSLPSPINNIGSTIIQNEPISMIATEITHISSELINDVGEAFGKVCYFVKESDIVTSSINIGQVGLGSLRNTIFGFIS
ncbi:hypothetical protein G9P44_002206 [Scheffersomyces stipitis]|nr:hypothetical protein G9P44_002206 [Scheffersomyces stipitis]